MKQISKIFDALLLLVTMFNFMYLTYGYLKFGIVPNNYQSMLLVILTIQSFHILNKKDE